MNEINKVQYSKENLYIAIYKAEINRKEHRLEDQLCSM